MEKTTVLVIQCFCGDQYYPDYTLSWREVSYLDSEEKKAQAKQKIYDSEDFYGETAYFLDAFKIDGKIFIDIEGLLGSPSENEAE